MRTVADARELAARDARARRPGGDGRRLRADGHGSAARPRRRQRARGAARLVETVSGGGPPDFRELVVDAAAQLARALGSRRGRGRRAAPRRAGARGRLRRRPPYDRWVRAQGGDPDPARLPSAPVVRLVPAPETRLSSASSRRGRSPSSRWSSARAASRAGTRSTTPSASSVSASAGEAVDAGEPLAEIHARDEAAADGGRHCAPGRVRDRRTSRSRVRSSSTSSAERQSRTVSGRLPNCRNFAPGRHAFATSRAVTSASRAEGSVPTLGGGLVVLPLAAGRARERRLPRQGA